MAEPDPIDQALDLLVFAPLGLLLSARELVPKLAEKGRAQIASRAPAARMVGELAVRQGPREAQRVVRHLVGVGGRFVDDRLGGLAAAQRGPAPPSPPAGSDLSAVAGVRPPTTSSASRPTVPEPSTAVVSAAHLAIPGYDSLSASQVVARLEGLGPADLDEIRVYEQSGRARRTVLTRISQLRPASD